MAKSTPERASRADRAKKLSLRERLLLAHYVHTHAGNATAAAIEAGYSPRTAGQIAHEVLRRPHVRAKLDEMLAAEGVTAERLERRLSEMAFESDLADFEGLLTGAESLAELRERGVKTRLLQSVKRRRRAAPGEGEDASGGGGEEDVEIRLHDPIRAAAVLVKMHGLGRETRRHEGDAARPIIVEIHRDSDAGAEGKP